MSLKPWLSKNFLQGMTWSNVRDYPPKRKKPWLFDNFMEMEEIHSDLMEEPWGNPSIDPALPPNPDVPTDPEDVEPDPCEGDRNLWVVAEPSSIDCDVSTAIVFGFSPDFKCIELTQAFYDEDKPRLVYGEQEKTLKLPTNVKDIVGGLKIKQGCEDGSITLWATDCLCGGSTAINISMNNCGTDCDSVFISGSSTIPSTASRTYTLNNFPSGAGQVQWNVHGTGANIGQDGQLFTSGACGMLTVIANSACCGPETFDVMVTDSGIWVPQTVLCDSGESSDGDCAVPTGLGSQRHYLHTTGSPEGWCDSYTPPPCQAGVKTVYVADENWECPP